MNLKTTVALGFLLAALLISYAFLRPSLSRSEPTAPPAAPSANIARELIDADLGNVEKVSVRKGEGPAWVFERDNIGGPGLNAWNIVEPLQAKAAGWEVERFGRDLKNVKYEISYRTGAAGGISAAEAGLEPPQAEITLSNAEGKSVTVQIGKPAPQSQTYVRLAGGDEIIVAKSNLRNLIKSDVAEYRDTSAWSFAPENARRLEITDRHAEGGPATYVFVRDGGQWKMESPAVAQATNKVNEAVQALSRLRVMKWLPRTEGSLAALGLDPAALTLKVTVEEQVPVKKDDPAEPAGPEGDEEKPKEEEPPAAETKTSVYEVHVSDVSPIGEDTKTHVRVGEEKVAGTIMKTTTDKLKPVMAEWREMRLTTADVDRATRIELAVGGDTAVFTKSEDEWALESGASVEQSEIETLLSSIRTLDAVVFLEPGEHEPGATGLSTPRAQVTLTIPGGDGPERIALGGYTDEAAKRMLYARRGESQVAKVRAQDIEPILRPITAYYDRTIFTFDAGQVGRLALKVHNPFTNGMTETAFAQDTGGGWQMVEPMTAPADAGALAALTTTLSGLRGETVAAASGDPGSFGLDTPIAVVTITSPSPGSPGGEDTATASATYELSVGQHAGKWYAKRADASTIFEVGGDVVSQLSAEHRARKLFSFEPTSATRFSIQQADGVHTFVRKDSGWVYESEPDLPLNVTKVEGLLLQVKDLEATRYVVHEAGDLAAFGLNQPAIQVIVTSGNGQEHRLLVAEQSSTVPEARGVFATTGNGAVLVLPEDVRQRLRVNLGELEAA